MGPYFRRVYRKYRSTKFMAGVTLFLIFFLGAIGGFIYRDLRSSEITKAREVAIMKAAIDKCQKEATRRAQAMLEANRAQGAGR